MTKILIVIAVTIVLLCLLEGCFYLQSPLQIAHVFDDFVVMKTSRALVDNPDVGHRGMARTVYRKYKDEFDCIVLPYDVSREQQL